MMNTCDDCGQTSATRCIDNNDEARELCEPCIGLARDDRPLRVSPLKPDDLELVLAWRSNPEVYHHFRQQEGPLDWNKHVAWYESRDSDRYDFVVYYEGRRVGVVSIDHNDEVGIYLGDFSAHGHGVATAAMEWLCDRFKDHWPLFAEVHKENDASRLLFERCGFQQKGRDDEWLQYVYDS